jgi:hypothetical protein
LALSATGTFLREKRDHEGGNEVEQRQQQEQGPAVTSPTIHQRIPLNFCNRNLLQRFDRGANAVALYGDDRGGNGVHQA